MLLKEQLDLRISLIWICIVSRLSVKNFDKLLLHCLFTITEAEYAFQQRKKIVPLMLQRGYKPDGWLGFILGAKLFFDFSGKYSFQDKFNDLFKELHRIKGASQGVPNETVVPKKVEVVNFIS